MLSSPPRTMNWVHLSMTDKVTINFVVNHTVMYVYVYVCICVCVYVYVCIHMYVYVHVCMCMYMYMYINHYWKVFSVHNDTDVSCLW